jgi:hypothetical protein
LRDAENNVAGVEFDLGIVMVERGSVRLAGPLQFSSSLRSGESLSVGDPLSFTLGWYTGDAPNADISIQLTLRNQADEILYTTTFAPAGPDYPSSQWQPNEFIRYPHTVTLPPDLPAGPVKIAVTFVDAAGVPISQPFKMSDLIITVPERSFAIPPMMYRANYDFAGTVRLLGYDIAADGITLYWQALQPVPTRLTVFVHVLDNAGNLVSGQDAPPIRATTGWLPDEVITDVHPFAVGDHFAIGLYDSLTGERLGEPYSHQP